MIPAVDLFQFVDGHAGVNLCGRKGFMAEHFLDVTDGRTVPEHVRCTGVPIMESSP